MLLILPAIIAMVRAITVAVCAESGEYYLAPEYAGEVGDPFAQSGAEDLFSGLSLLGDSNPEVSAPSLSSPNQRQEESAEASPSVSQIEGPIQSVQSHESRLGPNLMDLETAVATNAAPKSTGEALSKQCFKMSHCLLHHNMQPNAASSSLAKKQYLPQAKPVSGNAIMNAECAC